MPSLSKYKVYIIDEVHMLSSSAWNAFLKTLEEPPTHVIFILATTEIQKFLLLYYLDVKDLILKNIKKYYFDKIKEISKLENIK